MTTQFAQDLRLARKKAGLVQRDTAHLLAINPTKLTLLEHGRRYPTVIEICTLSLIYGRSFESLFSEIMETARHEVLERLRTLPGSVRQCAATFNRESSLTRLQRRLEAEIDGYGV